MDEQTTVGIHEPRYALSIVICCLLGVGFMALNYLSGSGNAPPVETRTPHEAERPIGEAPAPRGEEEIQVLTIENGESPMIHASQTQELSLPPHTGSEALRGAGSRAPVERR